MISVSTHPPPPPDDPPGHHLVGALLFLALGGGLATLGIWALMVPA